MELTTNWKRWAFLVVILAIFAACGGYHLPGRASRGWVYALAAFHGGAVSMSVIDHWVGNLDRSNLRWAYIVLGFLVMSGALLCLYVLFYRPE